MMLPGLLLGSTLGAGMVAVDAYGDDLDAGDGFADGDAGDVSGDW
jgi:hypothetical protein